MAYIFVFLPTGIVVIIGSPQIVLLNWDFYGNITQTVLSQSECAYLLTAAAAAAFVGHENSQMLSGFVAELLGQFLLMFFMDVRRYLLRIRFDRADCGLVPLTYFGVCLINCQIVQLLTTRIFNFNLWIRLRLIVCRGDESLVAADVVVVIVVVVLRSTEIEIACDFLFGQNRLLYLRHAVRLSKYDVIRCTGRWPLSGRESLEFREIVRTDRHRRQEIVGWLWCWCCPRLFLLALIDLARTSYGTHVSK